MSKRIRGVVESDRMDKTITVNIERLQKHPRYKKYVAHNKKLKAHDPQDEARNGDVVEIEETRPVSKTKSWRLVRILKRAAPVT